MLFQSFEFVMHSKELKSEFKPLITSLKKHSTDNRMTYMTMKINKLHNQKFNSPMTTVPKIAQHASYISKKEKGQSKTLEIFCKMNNQNKFSGTQPVTQVSDVNDQLVSLG